MAPGGAKEPAGALAAAITKAFGGLPQFKEQFQKACVGRFGSGWGWLIADRGGALSIESTPNQDTPLMTGRKPILGCDVWEHAYYLKYQNRRPDYVTAWWSVVNWTDVGRPFDRAKNLSAWDLRQWAGPRAAGVGSAAPDFTLSGGDRRDPVAASRTHGAAGLLPAGVHVDVHEGDVRIHRVAVRGHGTVVSHRRGFRAALRGSNQKADRPRPPERFKREVSRRYGT
jgi:hypothetical protein